MSDAFDDPEVRAEMARLGIVHKPGMAAELMRQLSPLLAAEGIDLDDPDADFDLEALNAAMARATEQHNLLLATPIGAQRAGALALLRRITDAIAADDVALAQALLSSVGPEPDGDAPAISHVIGVSLGLLDTWSADPSSSRALGAVRPPRWPGRPARAAATDILALAGKGRAFDSQQSLIARHRGLAVYEGGCLAVAASVIARAAREGIPVDELAGRILVDGTDASARPLLPASTGPTTGTGQPGAAFRRPQVAAAGPAPERADRTVVYEFGAWLRQLPEFDAAMVGDATGMLEILFSLARRAELDPHDPYDIEELVDLLVESTSDEATVDVLDTLDLYLHFRIETAEDAAGWEDVHDLLEDAMADVSGADDVRDAIDTAIADSLQLAPEQRRSALAQTRVVSAVSGLLDWLGAGQAVTSTGGVRRADIAHVAGLLGVSAIGVSRLPIPSREDLESRTIHAQSMWDVPILAAWWEGLLAADLIETTPTRVRPGSAAAGWSAVRPPLETAELLVGVFLGQLLSDGGRLPMLAGSIASGTLRQLLRAIAPDSVEADETDEADEAGSLRDSIVADRVLETLRDLRSVGLVELDGDDVAVVPVALRGVVARGILLTLAFAAADDAFD